MKDRLFLVFWVTMALGLTARLSVTMAESNLWHAAYYVLLLAWNVGKAIDAASAYFTAKAQP